MKFGLFYEIRCRARGRREKERTVYNNCLEQVKLADELGFDQVWAVEHHFLEEYSHCSAPEVFLTACAVLTKRIQVGHGIVVCVPEFNHPIKIAERRAALDIISGGRLRGRHRPLGDLDRARRLRRQSRHTKKSWDEFVRCLPKMWTQETFSYQGEFWSMPERTILPKPYQKPHPPMWVAVTSPGTEIDAADRGLGSLGLSFAGFEEQEKKITEYRRRIQYVRAGRRVRERAGRHDQLPVLPRGRGDRRRDGQAARQHLQLSRDAAASRRARSSPRRPTSRSACCRRCAAPRPGPTPTSSRPRAWPMAIPRASSAPIKKWESLGVDCINFILNANEMVPQEQVMASLRLFAKEVMPVFAKKPASAAAAE